MHKLNFNFSTFSKNTSNPKKGRKDNRNNPTPFLFIVTLLVGFLSPHAATAATYYVSTTGSNSNSCATAQTITTPKRTVSGSSGGVSCLQPGDTLYVRAGTYAEGLNAINSPSGTSSARI